MIRSLLPLTALTLSTLALGCTKQAQVKPTVSVTQPAPAVAKPDRSATRPNPAMAENATEPALIVDPAPLAALVFPVVGFEFDSELLTTQGRDALDAFAASYRQRHEQRDLVIEGHADERGPEEYNIVLGQKRATAVRRYLSTLGVSEDALRTVSYGENKPVFSGSDENAFRVNRRAAIVPR